MTNPLANIPCPIRLSTKTIPSAQKVPIDGGVEMALLVGGLEAAPKTSAAKTSGTVAQGSSLIALPPGMDVHDVTPGGVLAKNGTGFLAGSVLEVVHEGVRKSRVSITKDSPVVCLSPLSTDGDLVVGAKVSGPGIPAGTTIGATATSALPVKTTITNGIDSELAPASVSGLVPGMTVVAPGIPADTVIKKVIPEYLTLSAASTAALPAGTDAVFADLPELVATTVTHGLGVNVITPASLANLKVGMKVSSAGLPYGTLVMKVNTVSGTIEVSQPTTAAAVAPGASAVFTAVAHVVARPVQNEAGSFAATTLKALSAVGVVPGMLVEANGVPPGTTVVSVSETDKEVVIAPVLDEDLTQRSAVFRDAPTQFTAAITNAVGSAELTTVKPITNVEEGMIVSAPNIPAGAMVTGVTATKVTLSADATAANIGVNAVFTSPLSSVALNASCAAGISASTALSVQNGDAAKLRLNMRAVMANNQEAGTVRAIDGASVTVSKCLPANATAVDVVFSDPPEEFRTTITAAAGGDLAVASAANLVVGMMVSAPGLPAGTIVTAISGKVVTVNVKPTAAIATTTAVFTKPYGNAIATSVGYCARVKAKTVLTPVSMSGLLVGMTVDIPNGVTNAKITKVNSTTVEIDKVVTLAPGIRATASFKPLKWRNVTLTANNSTATAVDTKDLLVGMVIRGDGLLSGTKITSVGATTLTLSAAATKTVTGGVAVLVLESAIQSQSVTIGEITNPTTTVAVPNAATMAEGMALALPGLPYGGKILSKTASKITVEGAATASLAAVSLQNIVRTASSSISTTTTTMLTLADTAGLTVNMLVTGAGIVSGAKIKAINATAKTVELTVAGTASATPFDVTFLTAEVKTTMAMDARLPDGSYTLIADNATAIHPGMLIKNTTAKVTAVSGKTLTVSSATELTFVAAAPVSVCVDPLRVVTATITNDLGIPARTVITPAGGSSTGGLVPGMVVGVKGVPAGAKIINVTQNDFTIDATATALTAARVICSLMPRSVETKVTINKGAPDHTVLLLNDTSGLMPGMLVAAQGAPPGTKITKVEKDSVVVGSVMPANSTTDAVFVHPGKVYGQTATAVSGKKLTLANASWITSGMRAEGPGIEPGTMVMSVSAGTVQLSSTPVAAPSAVTFTQPSDVVVATINAWKPGTRELTLSSLAGIVKGMTIERTGLQGVPALATVTEVGKDSVTVDTVAPADFVPCPAAFIAPPAKVLTKLTADKTSVKAVPESTNNIRVGMSVAAAGLPLLATVTKMNPATLDISPAKPEANPSPVGATFLPPVAAKATLTAAFVNGSATVTIPSTAGLRKDQLISSSAAPASAKILSITNDTTFEMSAPATETASAQAVFGPMICLSRSCSQTAVISVDAGPVLEMDTFASISGSNGTYVFQGPPRDLDDVRDGDYCVLAVQVVSIGGDTAYLMAYGYARNANPGMRQFYLWDHEEGGSPIKELTMPGNVNSMFWGYGPGPHLVGVFQKPLLALSNEASHSVMKLAAPPKLARSGPLELARQPLALVTSVLPHLSAVKSNEYLRASWTGLMTKLRARLGYLQVDVKLAKVVSEMRVASAELRSSKIEDLRRALSGMVMLAPPVLSGHEHVMAEGQARLALRRPVLEYGTGITLMISAPASLTKTNVELTFTPATPPEEWIFEELPKRRANLVEGSAIITIPAGTADLAVGMGVSGEGIPEGATVALVPAATMSATVKFRAWAAAHMLIEGLGLSVRDVARDCLAVWNLRGTGSVSDELKERVLSDINAAMQLIYSRARELDYFNLATYELEVPFGSNNIAVPADVQQIVGNVRMSVNGALTPLWALQSMAELEQFGPCYLGIGPTDHGTPQAYFVDRRAQPEWNSVGMAIYVAPTPPNSVVLEVDAAVSPPRFHWDDVVKATPLRLPHAYAETLLMPIVRQRATAYKLFTNDTLKPAIEAQYEKAMEALGLLDPAPKQAGERGVYVPQAANGGQSA